MKNKNYSSYVYDYDRNISNNFRGGFKYGYDRDIQYNFRGENMYDQETYMAYQNYKEASVNYIIKLQENQKQIDKSQLNQNRRNISKLSKWQDLKYIDQSNNSTASDTDDFEYSNYSKILKQSRKFFKEQIEKLINYLEVLKNQRLISDSMFRFIDNNEDDNFIKYKNYGQYRNKNENFFEINKINKEYYQDIIVQVQNQIEFLQEQMEGDFHENRLVYPDENTFIDTRKIDFNNQNQVQFGLRLTSQVFSEKGKRKVIFPDNIIEKVNLTGKMEVFRPDKSTITENFNKQQGFRAIAVVMEQEKVVFKGWIYYKMACFNPIRDSVKGEKLEFNIKLCLPEYDQNAKRFCQNQMKIECQCCLQNKENKPLEQQVCKPQSINCKDCMKKDLEVRKITEEGVLVNKDGILSFYCQELDLYYCKRNLEGKFCLLDENENCQACKCLKQNSKLYKSIQQNYNYGYQQF